MIKLNKVFLILILLVGAVILLSPERTMAAEKTSVAPEGVRIGGYDISGMSIEEAENGLSDYVRKYNDTVFTLVANESELEATGEELSVEPVDDGVLERAVNYGKKGNLLERYIADNDVKSAKGKDFELIVSSDWNTTKEFLEKNREKLDVEATEHSLKREGGQFVFIEGKTGVVVDAEASATAIGEYISNKWGGGDDYINLEVVEQEPKGSKEDLMNITDLLGSCSTDYSFSSANRANNVKLGTSKINGSIVFPGEEYSVSENLGARNAENGYMPAPSFENGSTVDSYGGGVCQISTTLYNALIRSEIEIVRRNSHSMLVSYIKPSMDAAIAEGVLDLVFKNNTNYPIYIEGYTGGGEIGFNIFGKDERDKNRKVTFESETTSTTPFETQYKADSTLPLGTIQKEQDGHTGVTARLWKIVTVDGKEESKEVFNQSRYAVSNTIYKVGTAVEGKDVSELIAAIDTGDRVLIDAAIANISANITPEPAPEVEQVPVVPPTEGQ